MRIVCEIKKSDRMRVFAPRRSHFAMNSDIETLSNYTSLEGNHTMEQSLQLPVTALDISALPKDRRKAAELALEARARSTRVSYRIAIERLEEFLGCRPLTDDSLSEHVEALAIEGMAPATIAQACAAAAFFARAAGLPSPRGTMTADALRIVRRDHSDRGRGQARPISADDVTRIINTSRAVGRDQDAAIAGLLFQGALRRSEVAALEWRDIESAPNMPGALLIRVRTKKTDQTGEETDIRLVKSSAAAALSAIRPENVDPRARVFGINGQSVGRRFAAAARAAGIAGVTAHSGRVGHASELTARGATTTEVMLSGGWKTARMVAHYSAGARAERGAVAKYL